MILEPPNTVQKLQAALQAKAKGAPDYRFYLLYDKLYRKDVLTYAYQRCKANKGAPGIDDQDFADIAALLAAAKLSSAQIKAGCGRCGACSSLKTREAAYA